MARTWGTVGAAVAAGRGWSAGAGVVGNEPESERAVVAELDDRREEERRHDSEWDCSSWNTGVPTPAGAQPQEGEGEISPLFCCCGRYRCLQAR